MGSGFLAANIHIEMSGWNGVSQWCPASLRWNLITRYADSAFDQIFEGVLNRSPSLQSPAARRRKDLIQDQ